MAWLSQWFTCLAYRILRGLGLKAATAYSVVKEQNYHKTSVLLCQKDIYKDRTYIPALKDGVLRPVLIKLHRAVAADNGFGRHEEDF
jgi:hypothetical protein